MFLLLCLGFLEVVLVRLVCLRLVDFFPQGFRFVHVLFCWFLFRSFWLGLFYRYRFHLIPMIMIILKVNHSYDFPSSPDTHTHIYIDIHTYVVFFHVRRNTIRARFLWFLHKKRLLARSRASTPTRRRMASKKDDGRTPSTSSGSRRPASRRRRWRRCNRRCRRRRAMTSWGRWWERKEPGQKLWHHGPRGMRRWLLSKKTNVFGFSNFEVTLLSKK